MKFCKIEMNMTIEQMNEKMEKKITIEESEYEEFIMYEFLVGYIFDSPVWNTHRFYNDPIEDKIAIEEIENWIEINEDELKKVAKKLVNKILVSGKTVDEYFEDPDIEWIDENIMPISNLYFLTDENEIDSDEEYNCLI